MTGLHAVMNCFTGPRRLRSVLRQSTAPMHQLLKSLDGPTELRASIPATVFGGDIFDVMSQHLRAALMCPPPQRTSAPRSARRKHVLQSTGQSGFAKAGFQNPLDVFPLLDSRLMRSTLSESTSTSAFSPVMLDPMPALRRLDDSSGERVMVHPRGNTNLTEVKKKNEILQQPQIHQDTRTLAVAPALVNSLQRYWELMPEKRETHTLQPSHAEVLTGAAGFPITEPEQRTASRSWPTFTGNDVAEKLRAFGTGSHSSLKPTRSNTTPDHQVQNVFNIEVRNGNQNAPTYDDLGERIAAILHEQALQHGIDVT